MASFVNARTRRFPVFSGPVMTVVASPVPFSLVAAPRGSVIAVALGSRRRHQTPIGGLPVCLLPGHTGCGALRPRAPETPPYPPPAIQEDRLDLDEWTSAAGSPFHGLPSSIRARLE